VVQWVGTIQQFANTGPVAVQSEAHGGPYGRIIAWTHQYEHALLRQTLLTWSE